MRWPFRSKSSPPTGDERPAASGTMAASMFAASVRRNEWAALPPAPIAISTQPPATIVGSASAIRRPIGLRDRVDVSEFAAVGVVDGLARVESGAPSRPALLPEPPVGEASALPTVAPRSLRTVVSGAQGATALTTSESVPVVGPTAESSRADLPKRDSPPVSGRDADASDMAMTPRSSLAQSRRLGLGPGYHGPLPDAMRRDRFERTSSTGDDDPTEFTEQVPDDLRTIMRAAYGIDVGDQVVHRGTGVSDEARQLGARAYARDGEVFVPIDAGPLDEAPAKSLLAHELTHLAQQRRRTAPLPADGSAEELVLEAEAQRAERFVRGDPGVPSPGPMTEGPQSDRFADEMAETQQFVNELVHRGVAEPDGTGGVRFLWGQGSSQGGGGGRVQRATEPAGAAAQQENWGVAASFGHALTETFVGEFEDMLAGEFSFVSGIEEQMTTDRDAREREFRREQTKEAFGRLRLEHLRVTTRNAAGGVLTDAQEKDLQQAVDIEVLRRTDALEFRVKRHLEEVNEKLKSADQPTHQQLDPDRYDAIFNKLFAVPDGDLPDDDPPEDVKAHADRTVNKARAKQAAASVPKAGGPPPGGPPGKPTGSGLPIGGVSNAADEPVIDSMGALKGAFLTDLVTLEAAEFGITLTDDERREIYNPAAASMTAAAKTTDGAPTSKSPVSPTAPGGAAHEQKHVGPSGHEKIDLDRLDLEELTKRLFPRLRTSLRQELIVDRERAGRLNH